MVEACTEDRDLVAALAALREAEDKARRLAGDEAVRDASHRLEQVHRRQGYLGDTVVLALVGGTGVGKSSLLNVLAGRKISTVGVRRPTTERPVAAVPANPEPGLIRLLDDLGIEEVAEVEGLRVAVIDLPDLDSVQRRHRATVDALLPRVDGVIWVLGPEKYADRALHQEVLAPRARWQEGFVFVLNQTDRIRPFEREAVADDLRARLRQDGIDDPTIVLTAAAPPDGPPQGIDRFRAVLEDRLADKRVALETAATHLAAVRDDLQQFLGDVGDLEARWEDLRTQVAEKVAETVVGPSAVEAAEAAGRRRAAAAGAGPVRRVVSALSSRGRRGRPVAPFPSLGQEGPVTDSAAMAVDRFVRDVSRGAGGPAGRRLRETLPPEQIEREVRRAAESAAAAADPPADVPRRPTWAAAGVLQVGLTLLVLVGIGWWWTDPGSVAPGQFPWPVALVAGGLAIGALASRAVRSSGARAGRQAALEYRARLTDALDQRLDRDVGQTLRDHAAAHEALRASLEAADRAL